MKNGPLKVLATLFGFMVLASSLFLIAQNKHARTGSKSAKATGTRGPVSHVFGETTIHVNYAACELQEPMVHADPKSNNGKVNFTQINGTTPIKLNISNGVLNPPQVTVPAHGVVQAAVDVESGAGVVSFADACFPQQRKGPKGNRGPSDPNEILVP